MAVAYAKLGVGQPCGHIGMYLGVDIRVDPNQDARRLVNSLRSLCDVLQVEFRVHIDESALVNGQAQLCRKLSIAVENCPAQATAHLVRQGTHAQHCFR